MEAYRQWDVFRGVSISCRIVGSSLALNFHQSETQHEKRIRLFSEFFSLNHIGRLSILRQLLQS